MQYNNEDYYFTIDEVNNLLAPKLKDLFGLDNLKFEKYNEDIWNCELEIPQLLKTLFYKLWIEIRGGTVSWSYLHSKGSGNGYTIGYIYKLPDKKLLIFEPQNILAERLNLENISVNY